MNSFKDEIDLNKYNVFLIDDFLESINSPRKLKRLLDTIGYSNEAISEYERKRGLPTGCLELAIMLQDPILKHSITEIVSKLNMDTVTDDSLMETIGEDLSRFRVLERRYPNAIRFVVRYSTEIRKHNTINLFDERFVKNDAICSPLFCVAGIFLVAAAGILKWVAIANVIAAVNVGIHVNALWNTRTVRNTKQNSSSDGSGGAE